MLSEFLMQNEAEIVARCRARAIARAARARGAEPEHGISMFLHELALELGGHPEGAIAAGRHGAELLRGGFTIAHVVHEYGDVCQTITELAIERDAPITVAEFRALNLCLDNAIAAAVTEYERRRELDVVTDDVKLGNQQLGFLAHELRNQLGGALLAFEVLRTGSVGIHGSTGDVLGRSLIGLRDLVDRSLAEVRLTAGITKLERIHVPELVDELEASALLRSNAYRIELTVSPVEPGLAVLADRQILASVIANLLQNAFKYTRPHSHVWLRAHATAERVLFDIEDQCGGLPPTTSGRLFEPCEQHGVDRSGLGLAICARGVAALRGEIRTRNQNQGCVFTVDLPRSIA